MAAMKDVRDKEWNLQQTQRLLVKQEDELEQAKRFTAKTEGKFCKLEC